MAGVEDTELSPELERRIREIEAEGSTGRGLSRECWMWLLVLGLIVPVLLLVWGWPG